MICPAYNGQLIVYNTTMFIWSWLYVKFVNMSMYTQLTLTADKATGICNHNRISFRGDVVLGSFNMGYRDEDSIVDQLYQKQIFSDFYHEDLKV